MVVIVLVAYLSVCFVFFKQKTAYEMRISDWSSDVCSSVLRLRPGKRGRGRDRTDAAAALRHRLFPLRQRARDPARPEAGGQGARRSRSRLFLAGRVRRGRYRGDRKRDVEGKRVSGRVALGGRRIITQKRQSLHVEYYND